MIINIYLITTNTVERLQEARLDYQFGKADNCPDLWLQTPKVSPKPEVHCLSVCGHLINGKLLLYFHSLNYNVRHGLELLPPPPTTSSCCAHSVFKSSCVCCKENQIFFQHTGCFLGLE